MLIRILAAFLLAFGTASPVLAQPGGADDEARVETGMLRGQGAAFRNIPYARPPVGALRWRPPQPALPWRGVRDATKAGPDCIGGARPADTGSEDCLTLSIWQPARPLGGRVPVVVWFHQGGAVQGSAFADKNVVFVSVNYRLGRFGTFAHPALAGEAAGAPSGNFGLMDQIAALQWVRRNIDDFGGDPDQIVLMGQGRAGGSVLVLMTSPAARGLFQRVIVQSPVHPGARDPALPNFAAAAQAGAAFARSLGIPGSNARALRALPAARLAEDAAPRLPMIDGTLVVEPPEAAFRAGRQASVPILVGANTLEDDGAVLEPARFVAQAMAGAGQPVWHYRISYVAQARRAKDAGATHGSEIPFLLLGGGIGAGAEDRAEAQLLVEYWSAFARTGDPNERYRPRWRRFDSESGAMMDFTAAGAWSGPDPLRARLDARQARREGRAPPPAGPGPEIAGALRPYAALVLPPTRPAPGRPSVFFLGAASLLLTDDPHAIVVNGFVTRPSEAEVRGGRIAPDFFRVHELRVRFLIPFIDAALVSDSHFDHSMDAVSWVRYSPALLIGSASTANLGRGSGLEPAQLRVARDREVFALGPFRVTAIAAPHAPHGVGEAFPGTIEAPLPPPIPVSAYREGGSFSFLIEHGGRGILVHASADFRPGLMRGVRAETVLLGIAGLGARDAGFVEAYWREIVRATGARIVVPLHWDRSGVPLDQPLEPGADFVRAMEMLTRLAARDGIALRLMPALEPVDLFAGDAAD